MSVPVRRQTHGKTRRRRAHHALAKSVLTACRQCAEPVQPHHACANCGYYAKKQVVDTSKKAEKALRAKKARKTRADIEADASAVQPVKDVAEPRQANDNGKKKAQVNKTAEKSVAPPVKSVAEPRHEDDGGNKPGK